VVGNNLQIWPIKQKLMDPESLYRQFGRLIESAPEFSHNVVAGPDHLMWIGRGRALLVELDETMLFAEFEAASRNLLGPRRTDAFKTIMLVLYKALASAEMKSPAGARGAFIPAGNAFDAFAALAKVLQTATSDVFIVDPYMDEVVLTEFASAITDGVTIRLLSDSANVKPTLAPAAANWVKQFAHKPLSVRLAAPRTLHDRAIFVDRTTGWILTQSLKDFAKRSPAEIVRADDTAALKIAAYEAVWTTAAVIA
jgi:hypothetical protein